MPPHRPAGSTDPPKAPSQTAASTDAGHAADDHDGQAVAQPLRAAPAMYEAADLAALLKCSVRKVWRMRDAKELPPDTRLGRLVRWPKAVIDSWIAAGCPTRR